jgi:predicted transcriptional regulator
MAGDAVPAAPGPGSAGWRGNGQFGMPTQRRYRTKLEVLRDLVVAAAREPRKTRIIGLANLNRTSFDRYARLALSLGLLEHRAGGYAPTALAEGWVDAVDSVLGKGSELSAALGQLSQLTSRGARPAAPKRSADTESTVRSIARLAWSNLSVPELAEQMASRSGGLLTVTAGRPAVPNGGGRALRSVPESQELRVPRMSRR